MRKFVLHFKSAAIKIKYCMHFYYKILLNSRNDNEFYKNSNACKKNVVPVF